MQAEVEQLQCAAWSTALDDAGERVRECGPELQKVHELLEDW